MDNILFLNEWVNQQNSKGFTFDQSYYLNKIITDTVLFQQHLLKIEKNIEIQTTALIYLLDMLTGKIICVDLDEEYKFYIYLLFVDEKLRRTAIGRLDDFVIHKYCLFPNLYIETPKITSTLRLSSSSSKINLSRITKSHSSGSSIENNNNNNLLSQLSPRFLKKKEDPRISRLTRRNSFYLF